MITLGVDAHKEVHVAVAVDEQGRPLETWQGPNSEPAWQEVVTWASQWESRRWGIEGTGNYGQGLAQHLVRAGETVYEVNPRLTAQADGAPASKTRATAWMLRLLPASCLVMPPSCLR